MSCVCVRRTARRRAALASSGITSAGVTIGENAVEWTYDVLHKFKSKIYILYTNLPDAALLPSLHVRRPYEICCRENSSCMFFVSIFTKELAN